MANKNIRLSIIIPAYNEALHITDTLKNSQHTG
jgi:glycosyltransferase involved in cell wall biosynthesis